MEDESVILNDIEDITYKTTSTLSSSSTTSSFLITKLTEFTTNLITTTATAVTIKNNSFNNDDVTHTEINENKHLLFSFIDYTIFALILGSSALIGVYFGFISKKKQDNTEEYLLGGKTMSTFPVSVSLIASHVSGITLLGVPAEMYKNGTQYWAHIVCAFVVSLLMAYVYLPVFYDLQLTSCFSYLEKRFDRSVRVTASFVYALSCIIFIPIVIYVPALAFSQVTGINLHSVTPIISIVCIFYTTIGGLKAVVWTDTLQFLLMVFAIVAVIVLGTLSVGGFIEVWKIADHGGRLIFFNMDPNPLKTTFWSVSIGLSVMWVSNVGVSQGCVQRFLAVPDIKMARRSVWIFALGLIFVKGCSCFTGLIMYAHYEKCDPFTSGKVEKIDQMLPYYVMDIASKIPGLPGLFIAGIFSAALSTMSSSLNTLAGTIYVDFLKNCLPNASEKTASKIMKILVVILGILEMFLVYVVEHLGAVFHLAISLSGVTAGTLLGMFTLGMVTRKANTKGVIAGSIVSLIVVTIILIGAQSSVKESSALLLRTDGCDGHNLLNDTILSTPNIDMDLTENTHWIFRINFMYYTLIGVAIVFLVGYPVSLITDDGTEIDEILLTPFCRSHKYKEEKKKLDRNEIYYKGIADQAIIMIKANIEEK